VSITFGSDQIPTHVRPSPVKSRKRRFDEIPDTEDDWSDSIDEYSFDEDDVHIIAVRPNAGPAAVEHGVGKKARAEETDGEANDGDGAAG
jgi:hypothetical protein